MAILNAVIALLPLFKSLISFFAEAKQNGWVKSAESLQVRIQTAKGDDRKDLARLLFEHRAE